MTDTAAATGTKRANFTDDKGREWTLRPPHMGAMAILEEDVGKPWSQGLEEILNSARHSTRLLFLCLEKPGSTTLENFREALGFESYKQAMEAFVPLFPGSEGTPES